MKYRVKYGVDLWLLAAWYYGSPYLWDVIYYANQEIIGDDPEALTPGMEIEIPDLEYSTRKYVEPVNSEAV